MTANAMDGATALEAADGVATGVDIGPDHGRWLWRDRQVVYESPYPPPLMFERASGCEIWDMDGRRYLDFESGQFCMSTGHSHPRVTEVVAEQAAQVMQIGNRFTTPSRTRLAEALAAIAPDPLGRSFFCSTGSEANEVALRLAKLTTGRFETVALARGYHGRTASAFAATSSSRRMRRGYGPFPPGVFFASPPHAYRCAFDCGRCDGRCWRHSVEMIDRATSGEPAAVIVEFILGAGGIVPVDPGWAREVRAFCDERGALLIADEALTGMGRTGRWFAFEHTGVVPDIVVTSKALGGGVPTAAVITTPAIAEAAREHSFLQASSHQGDPFQCAVALANIEIIEQEGLLDNAAAMGELIAAGLRELVDRHDIAGDARGIGLVQGLEIVDGHAEAPRLAGAVTIECLRRGLILGGLRPTVRDGNVLRLAPPLCVSEAEVTEALEHLDGALTAVSAGYRAE